MNTEGTYLTAVTLHMEVSVQGHDADSLLLTRCWHYRLRAHTAARSKLPVNGHNQIKEISLQQQEIP